MLTFPICEYNNTHNIVGNNNGDVWNNVDEKSIAIDNNGDNVFWFLVTIVFWHWQWWQWLLVPLQFANLSWDRRIELEVDAGGIVWATNLEESHHRGQRSPKLSFIMTFGQTGKNSQIWNLPIENAKHRKGIFSL